MTRQILLIITLLLLTFSIADAQTWKRQRVEYTFGLGATNFLGDLGGANQIGTNGLRDLEPSATRFALGLGYRYQLGKDWFVKANLGYMMFSGNDALTKEPFRNARQLNFRSHVIELSAQAEYMLIKQKSGHLYKLRGVRGKSWFRFEVYLFGGVGGIWFDPQGKDQNGNWHRLKPLHTEGQGLPGGPKQYSGFSLVIPYGVGIRRNLGGSARMRSFSQWSISLELSMRKTFTDYIDDVSTYYYGSDFIGEAYGEKAAYFADPSGKVTDHNAFGEPQQRGDKDDNDAYMLGMISVNYKISKRRRNLPKF